MTYHYNGWGRFFEQLERAKLKNPKPAAEYAKVSEELRLKEEYASHTFHTLAVYPNYPAYYEFRDREIRPLELKTSILCRQLHCKHATVIKLSDSTDACIYCQVQGILGVDFGVKLKRKSRVA